MRAFNIFRKKKPGAETVPAKPETQPQKKEQALKNPEPEAKTPGIRERLSALRKVELPRWRVPWWLRILNWREIPWWSRLIIILGMVGIGFAVWSAVQLSSAPPPTYRLDAAISPVDSGQISLSPGIDSYREGVQVNLVATPAAEYEFIGWSGDAGGASPTAAVVMNSDKAVIAHFRRIGYVLTTAVSPAEGGSISPASGTHDSGAQVTLTATPAAEYEFIGWSGDADGTGSTATVTIDSDKAVTALFRRIGYVLTTAVSPPEGGSVSPASGTYDSGAQVTLVATPAADYEFTGWSGDTASASPTFSLTMNSDKAVTALFAPTVQAIRDPMPIGISASVNVYTKVLASGSTIEGFAEISGDFKSYDRDFAWTFEIFAPEGRRIDYYRGHWVKDNHYEFNVRASLSGEYKIMVRHNSLYDKEILIKIRPMDWQ
ncbi:InlB B-repeat-containing protein [Chloroflexota bacterium]